MSCSEMRCSDGLPPDLPTRHWCAALCPPPPPPPQVLEFVTKKEQMTQDMWDSRWEGVGWLMGGMFGALLRCLGS